jgi:hypothetical protein
MNHPFNGGRAWRRGLMSGLPLMLLLAGCASAPPIPTANLQAAQQAVANAERVDAAAHAGAELGEARAKLSSAQSAVAKEDMVAAAQLADEARAGAELAAAKSDAAKAMAVNEDMKRSTATLKEEMQRKTGETR